MIDPDEALGGRDGPLRRADLSLNESALSRDGGFSLATDQKRLSKAAKTIRKIRAAKVMIACGSM